MKSEKLTTGNELLDTELVSVEKQLPNCLPDRSPASYRAPNTSRGGSGGNRITTPGVVMQRVNEPDAPEHCADTPPTAVPLVEVPLPSDTTSTETRSITSQRISPCYVGDATCSTTDDSKPSLSWHESISQRLYESAGIRPYYSQDGIVIIHGDCRDILPTLAPVDLVLTDPPYGLGDKWVGGGGEHTKTSWRFDPSEARSWDTDTVEGVELLPELARHTVIWGGNYYPLPPTRCWFLWDKKQNDQWTTAQAEMAWTNVDRPVRIFRMSQVVAHTEMGHKQHPTQKPVSLMRWCISMVPDDPQTILDPFMGSGTTLRAAKDMGRRAIGIEVSERYCEIAVRRLQQSVLPIFGESEAA